MLNRNPRNFFAQIEQIALDPGNIVPGVGLSPDRMLLARAFAYADQQRYRIGPNYKQLPVNQPINKVNTYEHEGSMQFLFNDEADPVHSPNRHAKGAGYLDDNETSGSGKTLGQAYDLYVNPDPHGTDLTRAAYVQHKDDDDFMQAGILVREVMDDAARERLANNIAGAMEGVHPDTEARCYEYWTKVDPDLGKRVEVLFKAKGAERRDGAENV